MLHFTVFIDCLTVDCKLHLCNLCSCDDRETVVVFGQWKLRYSGTFMSTTRALLMFDLDISLSHPVSIIHVTLSHITKSQSPFGNIGSGPMDIAIPESQTFSVIILDISCILDVLIHKTSLRSRRSSISDL